MRLVRPLSCAAALALVACGPEAEPLPPSGATALVRCTMTVAGTVADCSILQSSGPGSDARFLAYLRGQRFKPGLRDGTPVEIPSLFRLTFGREDGETAR